MNSDVVFGFLLKRRKCLLSFLWLVFLFAGIMAIRFANHEIEAPNDPYYYIESARGIAAGHGFKSLFNHAYSPPLFPAFLALLIRMGCSSILCLKFATLFAFSFSLFIIYRLCKALFGHFAGIAGAFFFTLFPWFITLPNYMLSENIFIPLFLLTMILIHRAFQKPSLRRFALAGLLCGVTALCREIVFYFPLLVFVVMLVYRKRMHRPIAKIIIFTLFLFAVVAPWTVRNYAIFGKLVPITTNSWINVYIGNNPRYDNISSFTWTIPEGTNWNVREQPDGKDEYEVMARCRSEAINYIVEYPGRFARRFVLKAWRFITPHFKLIGILGENIFLKIAVAVNLVLYSLFGLLFIFYVVKMRKTLFSDNPMLVLSILFILYSIAIAGLTYTSSRYRLPVTLLFIVYSTYFPGRLLLRNCEKQT